MHDGVFLGKSFTILISGTHIILILRSALSNSLASRSLSSFENMIHRAAQTLTGNVYKYNINNISDCELCRASVEMTE